MSHSPAPRESNRSQSTQQSEEQTHSLVAIDYWLPGRDPRALDETQDLDESYRRRFWRCRNCGQERNTPEAFRDDCIEDPPGTPLEEGGYDIKDGRTRRALAEAIEIDYGRQSPEYTIRGESGVKYTVDVEAETCSCPDFEKRGEELAADGGCKHLRRVDIEIRGGVLPTPEGRFRR